MTSSLFWPEHEARFVSEYRNNAIGYYRLMAGAFLGIMVVISVTGLFVEFSVNREGIQRLLWFGMIPPTAAALGALFLPVAAAHAQRIVMAFIVAIAAVSVIFPRISDHGGLAAYYGFSYASLVLFSMFVFGRLAPRMSLPLAAGILAAYAASIGTLPNVGLNDLVNHFGIMLGASALGFGIGYLMESNERRSFEARVIIEQRERALAESEARLKEATARSEALLLSILPEPIARRLKAEGKSIADGIVECSVLFSDLVGFSALSQEVGPRALVGLLNRMFSGFDELSEKHGLEKIKTIGDAYMVAGGVPDYMANHASAVADMALDMLAFIERFSAEQKLGLQVRIGIHSGPVVAGVIGTRKFSYDLWGDAVNVASRMESHGEPGRVQVTEATAQLLRRTHRVTERGLIEVKGKGPLRTFWLEGRLAAEAS